MKITLTLELDIPNEVYEDPEEDKDIAPENLREHQLGFVRQAVFDNLTNFAVTRHLSEAADALTEKPINEESHARHKMWAKVIESAPKMKIEALPDYDWWVYSTAIGSGVLMLECRNTGKQGIVKDPTKEEWREAFHAPSNPYRWADHSRVHIQ